MVRFILVVLFLCAAGHAGAQETKVEKSGEIVMFQGKSYYMHTVRAGQTLFSICKAYGVNVDEVQALNDMKGTSLSPGDVLRIPLEVTFKRLDDTYYYHRMRPKETLYSLSKKFKIKINRILKDNPAYDVSRPIAEGSIVRLALQQINKNVLEAELTWADYQAKEAEREKREQQHAGAVVPARQESKETAEHVERHPVDVVPARHFEQRHVKVAVLLPFFVKENQLPVSFDEIPVDSSGVNLRDERKRLNSRSEPFLQFYQGMLMAVDSLKQRGYTVELFVYDTEHNPAVVQGLVGELNRVAPDLIIGPVYADTYKIVADQLHDKTIPIVYPLSVRPAALAHYPNIVQTTISAPALVEEMADWIAENSAGAHVIQILPDGGVSGGAEGRLVSLVRSRLHGTRAITDYRWHASANAFRQVLKPDVENIILFPTNDEAAASRTLPVLSALADHYRITVIGFPEWLKFTAIDDEVYFKLNLKIFMNGYVDYEGEKARAFAAKYRDYFYAEPGHIVNRAYDMVLGLIPVVDAQRGNTMNALRGMDIPGQFTHFRFLPMNEVGGLENRGLYVINYNSRYTIIATPVQ